MAVQDSLAGVGQQVKGTMVLFLGTGIGMGIVGYALVNAITAGSESWGAALIGGIIILAALVAFSIAGPVLGAVTGVRAELTAGGDGIAGVTATGATVLIGHVAMVILAFVMTLLGMNTSTGGEGGTDGGTGGGTGGGGGSGSVDVADFILPIILGGVGAALTAIAAQFAYRELTE